MTDIVERLRLSVTKGHEPTDEDAIEAADEIEQLRALTALQSNAPGRELTAEEADLVDKSLLASTSSALQSNRDGWVLVPEGAVRCTVTGKPFGTDTWMAGKPCPCVVCKTMLAAKPLIADQEDQR